MHVSVRRRYRKNFRLRQCYLKMALLMWWTVLAPPAASSDRVIVVNESHQGAVPMQITTIGLDIAKNVFQVHAIDSGEKVVVRKQLRRRQVLEFFRALAPCLVGIEACATAHYWARELMKLSHLVRLMPAKEVKAYVKRNKNDAADAEAICKNSVSMFSG